MDTLPPPSQPIRRDEGGQDLDAVGSGAASLEVDEGNSNTARAELSPKWPAKLWHRGSPFMTSLVVHAAVLLLLSFLLIVRHDVYPGTDLTVRWQERGESSLAISEEPRTLEVTEDAASASAESMGGTESINESTSKEMTTSDIPLPRVEILPEETPEALPREFQHAGGLEGRSGGLKQQLLDEGGGNPQSERSVIRGLRWLAAHQQDDGSWRFDHTQGSCQGQCRHPGTFVSPNAATALALLPFLGAGNTHREGEFQDAVSEGIYFLGQQMLVTPHGGDLHAGSMYTQGLAAIVFCEAYAMTGDKNLRPYAQALLDFIVHAQHPAGGWRYSPGQPGDTTVLGWQMMALKSGFLAGLYVPTPTVHAALDFLDSVQTEGGASYGYQDHEPRPATSAVGLLCRMYTGWDRQVTPLRLGATYLGELGPSTNDMYFNYYATQVLRHYGGYDWQRWNEEMRDYLIATQATEGHEAGSWHFDEKHGRVGGRLYNTSMAVMILEVYYRHLPLYDAPAIERDF